MPWIPLVAAGQLAPGVVAPARHGALELVVWRDTEGQPHVQEARCPHQFNHLAAVGAVDGCELVCAAHFWRFDGGGTGTRRFSDGTREPTRDLLTFAAAELDGWVGAELP